MIINKGINDRNRYELPDLIIIAVFSSQNVPDNIPKQLVKSKQISLQDVGTHGRQVTHSRTFVLMRFWLRTKLVGLLCHQLLVLVLTTAAKGTATTQKTRTFPKNCKKKIDNLKYCTCKRRS